MQNNTHPAHHESNFQVHFRRTALDHFPEIPFPRDHSVMSQNLWFEGFFIPKALVGILEEDGNDEEITDEIHSVEDYDEDENE